MLRCRTILKKYGRMKDFYDSYYLSRSFDVDRPKLQKVLHSFGNPSISFVEVMSGVKVFLLPVWEAIVSAEKIRKTSGMLKQQ